MAIDLDPTNLSKEQAIAHFGNDYIVIRYAHDDCLSNGEAAPLYEAPDGPIFVVEYRQRGIAISLRDKKTVQTISYVKEPIGATSSLCHK